MSLSSSLSEIADCGSGTHTSKMLSADYTHQSWKIDGLCVEANIVDNVGKSTADHGHRRAEPEQDHE
jgi:hypothetical protein